MSLMDPAELVKQPQDVTENPYRQLRKEAQKTTKALVCAEVLLHSAALVSLCAQVFCLKLLLTQMISDSM